MRVAVVGAGVSGMTTAWEMLSDGHEVDIFEASSGIAAGASFASLGCIGLSSLTAWDFVSPHLSHEGIRAILPPPAWVRSLAGMLWLIKRGRHQSPDRQQEIFTAARAMAERSSHQMNASMRYLHIGIESTQGVMVALRSPEIQRETQSGLNRLKLTSVPVLEWDEAATRKAEPALSSDIPLVGSIVLPTDFAINGRQWLTVLKTKIIQLGGNFHMRTIVRRVTPDGRLETDTSSTQSWARPFDAIVICAAEGAPALLRPLGMELPLMTLNHCSVSTPVKDPLLAPHSVLIDAQNRVFISRIGQRIRASSAAAVLPGGNAQSIFQELYKALEDWFPGAAQLHGSQAMVQSWQASCAHTPDGLPLLGRTHHPRVWVNVGHGTRGWTFAPGAARLLADMLSGKSLCMDATAFDVQRAF